MKGKIKMNANYLLKVGIADDISGKNVDILTPIPNKKIIPPFLRVTLENEQKEYSIPSKWIELL
jgi:hypothetical protein